VAVWGLSFKPNTDDIREAPAQYIISELLNSGFSITAFDPVAILNFKKLYGNKINYASDPYEAVKNHDALIIITEWNEFRHADLKKVKKMLRFPVIFDGRNIYDPAVMQKNGFKYYSVGRSAVK